MKFSVKIAVLMMITVLFFSGCSKKASVDNSKLIVASSIVPETTFIKAVGGDLIDVVTLIPPGNSPANYELTPRDIELFSNAKIYFTIGVPAEEANILPRVKDLNYEVIMVDLAQAVSKKYPHRYFTDHEEGTRDPHIWLSPKRVKVMVDTIAEELAKIDEKNKDTYRENRDKYIEQLDILDEKIKNTLKDVKGKGFMIYHPSFGYFADDYHLEMVAVENHGKEATLKEFQEIIDIAREKSIKVVFYQEEIDSAQSKALAEELGGITQKLSPLAPDYIANLEIIADTFKAVLK